MARSKQVESHNRIVPGGTIGGVIEYRLAGERFCTRAEGRTTWHSFSFGAHYDPGNVGFASLVAHNDDRLPPGTGYADHPHADLEIVTWVLSGALRHTSSVGTGVIGPGEVQRLSAGSGVVHSEVADGTEETRFLQAWVRPDEPGLEPGYASAAIEVGEGWTHVAGAGGVPLASAGSSLHAADLPVGERLDLPDAARLHLFVASGQVMLGERLLEPGDAARLVGEGGRPVTAEAGSQLVVWSFEDPALRG
jgi:redox-sensitive bicupin YhaK (pirin superfamily)